MISNDTFSKLIPFYFYFCFSNPLTIPLNGWLKCFLAAKVHIHAWIIILLKFTLSSSINICILCRSEIHEKMNCIRCQNYNEKTESVEEGDENESANVNCQSDPETSDVGGFAKIAGCLHKLKRSEKQVGHIHFVDITASNFILGG